MSTIVEDLAAAKDLLATSAKDLAAAIAERDTAKAERDAAQTALDAMKADLAKLAAEGNATLAAVTAERDAAKALADKTAGELAEAQGKLRNPAHAIVKESQTAAAGAEGGQTKTRAQLEAEYAALPTDHAGAILRAEFRAKHKDALGL
jgi:hypothetical protein